MNIYYNYIYNICIDLWSYDICTILCDMIWHAILVSLNQSFLTMKCRPPPILRLYKSLLIAVAGEMTDLKSIGFWGTGFIFMHDIIRHPNASQNDDICIYCTPYGMWSMDRGQDWHHLSHVGICAVCHLLGLVPTSMVIPRNSHQMTCRMDSEWIFYLLHLARIKLANLCCSIPALHNASSLRWWLLANHEANCTMAWALGCQIQPRFAGDFTICFSISTKTS